MLMYSGNQYDLVIEKLNMSQLSLEEEAKKYEKLSLKLDAANEMLTDLKSTEYELVYIGEYKISHYCVERYAHICGGGNGITATGTTVTPGRTIAVDSSYIPYGSQVYIEGYGWRTAEDCGGGIHGKHIDMAVNTHDEAMSLGVKYTGVWLLVRKS